MKPRGIWIILGVILVIGFGSTWSIQHYISTRQDAMTELAAAGMDGAAAVAGEEEAAAGQPETAAGAVPVPLAEAGDISGETAEGRSIGGGVSGSRMASFGQETEAAGQGDGETAGASAAADAADGTVMAGAAGAVAASAAPLGAVPAAESVQPEAAAFAEGGAAAASLEGGTLAVSPEGRTAAVSPESGTAGTSSESGAAAASANSGSAAGQAGAAASGLPGETAGAGAYPGAGQTSGAGKAGAGNTGAGASSVVTAGSGSASGGAAGATAVYGQKNAAEAKGGETTAAETKAGETKAALSGAASDLASADEGTAIVLSRLQELDDQIAKNRASSQDSTSNSLKAAAETERKLWENELSRFLDILEQDLSKEEKDELMQEQNAWVRDREAKALEASQKLNSNTLQELEYNVSLKNSTRERVYELARRYGSILSEAE